MFKWSGERCGLGGQNGNKTNKKKNLSLKLTRKISVLTRGLVSLEVSVVPVSINNAVHIDATSWPHAYFRELRHGGSTPWVSTQLVWGVRTHDTFTCRVITLFSAMSPIILLDSSD